MKTLKWNGEFWYEDSTPLWNRIATWLIWIGGTGRDPSPVLLFGGRLTYYGWGAQLRMPDGDLLVVSWCGVDPSKWWRSKPASLYVSPDGTPGRSHTWLIGAPREVRDSAGAHRAVGRSAFGTLTVERPAGGVS